MDRPFARLLTADVEHGRPAPLRVGPALGAWLVGCLWVWAVWWGSLTGGPVFDDVFLVGNDRCWGSWDGLRRTLVWQGREACAYRPVRYWSYALDRAVWGPGWWGHHAGNVLWHAGAMGAAMALATRVFCTEPGTGRVRWTAHGLGLGVVSGLVWALHPVQTDSVSYMSGRRDILVGLFTLLAVGLALWAGRDRGAWRWMPAAGALGLGMLSKESAVVAPVLAGAWWSLQGGRRRGPGRGWWLAGAAGILTLGVGFVLWRGVLVSYSQRMPFEWWGGSIGANFATVASLQMLSMRLVTLQAPLIGDYHADTVPVLSGWTAPEAWGGAGVVVAMLALAWVCRRRLPVCSWGLMWWLVAWAPMSHILPHHELYAEHYLYVPLFGLVVAAVALGDALLQGLGPRRRWLGLLTVGVVLGTLSVGVMERHAAWQDERSFYLEVLRLAPGNQRAAANLIFIAEGPADWPLQRRVCDQMAPRWAVGSGQGRQALVRCTDAALQAGEPVALRRWAEALVRIHPDLGRGHRLSALGAAQQADCAGAWPHVAGWLETAPSGHTMDFATALREACGGQMGGLAVDALSARLCGLPETGEGRMRRWLGTLTGVGGGWARARCRAAWAVGPGRGGGWGRVRAWLGSEPGAADGPGAD